MALLSLSQVTKSFDGIYALKGVSFEVFEGECLALVGENGAGKSTLMKILSGVWPQGTFEGSVVFDGKPLLLDSPLDGRRSGVSIIHQELCLFPKLTVAENLFLTERAPYTGEASQRLWAKVDWELLNKRAEDLFHGLGFAVDPQALVEDLSVASRQLVEIAKAFHHKARVLILDEPTSALSTKEVDGLFQVIKRMKGKVTFIYISHKLDEVMELADRVVVLRDGQAVKSLQKSETSQSEIIRHMVGRPLEIVARSARTFETPQVLEVENLSHKESSGKSLLSGISFSVRAREVLGIAGLMGSGRSELLRSIIGVLPGQREGAIRFNGRSVSWQGISEAMDSGVAFVPEDRKKEGLFLDHAIDFNLSISILKQQLSRAGILDLGKEARMVDEYAHKMNVKCSQYSERIRNLSGGNQQKVLLAKAVARAPKILLLDEPTRGIDIGAKEEIYDIIRRLAADGMAIVVVSSELPEILALSDRVLVLREGRAVGELVNDHLTQEQIMSFAAGQSHAAVASREIEGHV